MKLDHEQKLKLIFIRDVLEDHAKRMASISFNLHKAIRAEEIDEELLDMTTDAYRACKTINDIYKDKTINE